MFWGENQRLRTEHPSQPPSARPVHPIHSSRASVPRAGLGSPSPGEVVRTRGSRGPTGSCPRSDWIRPLTPPAPPPISPRCAGIGGNGKTKQTSRRRLGLGTSAWRRDNQPLRFRAPASCHLCDGTCLPQTIHKTELQLAIWSCCVAHAAFICLVPSQQQPILSHSDFTGTRNRNIS